MATNMKRWVWHVTTAKKLLRYKQQGFIKEPVRAWENIEDAQKFSIQTGRRIILRLLLPEYLRLEGHKNKAVFSSKDVKFEG